MAIPTSDQFDEYLRRLKDASRTPLERVQAFPAEYSDSYPVINWVKRDKTMTQLGDALYQKSPAWSYEREYRLVAREKANTLFDFKPQGLSSVILGVNASGKLVDEVVQLLRERASKGLPPIKIFQSRLATARYRLYVARAREVEARCYI